jgi:hypothetical protein
MNFITFKENNNKENESFIFFLQYDGNEEQLNKLNDIISKTDFSDLYGGDCSTFEIDIKTMISENSVDQITKINLGCFSHLFNKCSGEFKFPYVLFEDLNESEMAFKLDQLFYACSIRNYFSSDKSFDKAIQYELEYNKKIDKINEYIEEFENEDYNHNHNTDYINKSINFLYNCIDNYKYTKNKKITLFTLLYKLFLTKSIHLYTNDNLKLKIIAIKKAQEFKKDIKEKIDKEEYKNMLDQYENLIIILDKYLSKNSNIVINN